MTSRLSLRDFSLALALVAIFAFFGWRSPHFLSSRNLSLLMIDFSITATLAIGMLLVILPGHIDLSAGSGVGLIGGIAAVLVTNHAWSAPFALLAGVGVAIVLWFAMGTLIVRQHIPAFIITLGGLLVFKGLFWLVIENHTVPVVTGGQTNLYSLLTTFYLPATAGYVLAAVVIALLVFTQLQSAAQRREHGFETEDGELIFLKLFIAAQAIVLFVLITNQFRGIPLPALILGAVALAVWTLTQHTPWGRYLYAIGGNEEAAVISGVPVERVTVAAFTLMGAIVALTGFMQTAYGGASTTTVGDLMELDAVAACVIGGVSLKGGRGSVLGVLFGALIMACLLNGMTLLAVQPEQKFIARGLVLILAVWMDVRLGKS
ncbi:MAG: D-xylose transport system permease protein [Chthoniobacter sp.]|jgi:D-xylose transport system permease protein|nr:D-xylose transport system permease protein [Chthoniobacter sp.]